MKKLCPIDGTEMRLAFEHTVLNRHPASYYQCNACGVLQVGDPFWLKDLYTSEITDLDPWVGIRSVVNQKRLEPILAMLFEPKAIFVEEACGYGLLTRLLRDIGFNVFGSDPFCESLFCDQFRPPPDVAADCVLGFEILEHVMDPVGFVKDCLERNRCRSLITSTTLFSGQAPDPSWSYYAFETGQHVTLHRESSLRAVGNALKLRYYRLMPDLHMFTDAVIPSWKLSLLSGSRLSRIYATAMHWRRRRASLTHADYQELLRRSREIRRAKMSAAEAP